MADQKKNQMTDYQVLKADGKRVTPDFAQVLCAEVRDAEMAALAAPISKQVESLVRKGKAAEAVAVLRGRKPEDGLFLAASVSYKGMRALKRLVDGMVRKGKLQTRWHYADSAEAEDSADSNPFMVLKGIVK